MVSIEKNLLFLLGLLIFQSCVTDDTIPYDALGPKDIPIAAGMGFVAEGMVAEGVARPTNENEPVKKSTRPVISGKCIVISEVRSDSAFPCSDVVLAFWNLKGKKLGEARVTNGEFKLYLKKKANFTVTVETPGYILRAGQKFSTVQLVDIELRAAP